jgi:hypothetical protein
VGGRPGPRLTRNMGSPDGYDQVALWSACWEAEEAADRRWPACLVACAGGPFWLDGWPKRWHEEQDLTAQA